MASVVFNIYYYNNNKKTWILSKSMTSERGFQFFPTVNSKTFWSVGFVSCKIFYNLLKTNHYKS